MQWAGPSQDLEARLKAKGSEIERLQRANAAARDRATAGAARWRRAREQCASEIDTGPLGACLGTLKDTRRSSA